MGSFDRKFAGPVEHDWRDSDAYRSLEAVERQGFAWEWLRRTSAYRAAWRDHITSTEKSGSADRNSARFGLISFEDPAQPFDRARPLWRADSDRSVIIADVLDTAPKPGDGIDLLAVASLVTLAVGDDDDEHLLLSDGRRSVRIDVKGGTLLGAPAMLSYRLSGASRLQAPLASLHRLIGVILTRHLPTGESYRERRARRWVMELRVADALAAGATQQEIARALFGTLIDEQSWRVGSASVRMRVRRLVRTAQLRMADGAHNYWLNSMKS